MTSDRTRDLLLPITILISVAVGAVIGGRLGRTNDSDRPHPGAALTDTKAVVDAIDALRADFTRLSDSLEKPNGRNASTDSTDGRSPLHDPTPDLTKISAQLAEAVEALRTAANRVGSDRSAPLIPPAVVDPGALKEVAAGEFEANEKQYILWTYQQVMDRFGPPTNLSLNNGEVVWDYRGLERAVEFHFVDGRVGYVRN